MIVPRLKYRDTPREEARATAGRGARRDGTGMQIIEPMQPACSPWRSALFCAAIAACGGVTAAGAADAGLCGDVERGYTLIKSITSVQLNTTLFQAADKGCEPLART